MSRCAKCDWEIVWAISPANKRIPLVRVTVYCLEHNNADPETPRAVKIHDADAANYISHFVDCPAAAAFSGQSRKRGAR